MKKIRDIFLDYVKNTPCLVCGRYGVDIAHIKPWSRKLNNFTRRTHKGFGWFYAVPLCRKHHLEQGKKNERDWFQENLYGGIRSAYAWILNAISEICDEHESIQRILENGSTEELAAAAYDILTSCQPERNSQ